MRLRGRGIGGGAAMGTAVIVRVKSGVPMPPEIPDRISRLIADRRLIGKPDVIVVADDYAAAAAVSHAIAWANVVGIAAARAGDAAQMSPVPAVVDLPALLDVVVSDTLLVIDASRSLALLDPTGVEVARFQAERDKIAPRRRIYLDEAHLPAQTLDGRVIQVHARVDTLDEVVAALEAGADGLLVSTGGLLLPATAGGHEHTQALIEVTTTAPGKPLLLVDQYLLDGATIAVGAGIADVTLFEPLRHELPGMGLLEMVAEIQGALSELDEREVVADVPRIGALLGPAASAGPSGAGDLADAVARCGGTRALLDAGGDLSYAETVGAACAAHLLPMMAIARVAGPAAGGAADERSPAGADSAVGMRSLLGAGAVGLVVAGEAVGAVKAIVRDSSVAECRDALLRSLA